MSAAGQSTVESDNSEIVSNFATDISQIVYNVARNGVEITDAVEEAKLAYETLEGEIAKETIGDVLVAAVAGTNRSESQQDMALVSAMLKAFEVTRLGKTSEYLHLIFEKASDNQLSAELLLEFVNDNSEILKHATTEELDEFIVGISDSRFESPSKARTLMNGILDAMPNTKLTKIRAYSSVIIKDFITNNRDIGQTTEETFVRRRNQLPEEVDSDYIASLAKDLAFDDQKDNPEEEGRRADLIYAVANVYGVSNNQVFDVLMAERKNIQLPFIRIASAQLDNYTDEQVAAVRTGLSDDIPEDNVQAAIESKLSKQASDVRMEAFRNVITGNDLRWSGRASNQELKDYALILLKPSQYGIAYNAIEQQAFRNGIWHWRAEDYNDVEPNALSLAKAAKAFDGGQPDGHKIQRMFKYIDGLMEQSSDDSTFNPSGRAIQFMTRILQSEMPMSAQSREAVFDKIVDMTIYAAQNVHTDQYYAQQFGAFERLSRAVDSYFSSFDVEHMHPAALARLNDKKEKFQATFEKFIADTPILGGQNLEEAIPMITKLGDKLSGGEEHSALGYKFALDAIEVVIASGKASTSSLTKILTSHEFGYHMPDEYKERRAALTLKANIEKALRGEGRGNEEALGVVIQEMRNASPEQRASLIERFAKNVESKKQVDQIQKVVDMAKSLLPEGDASIFVQPSYAATRIGGKLYVSFANVSKGGVDVAVHDGQKLKSLTKAAKAFAKNQDSSSAANQNERRLRQMVREGAYVASGVKPASVLG